MKKKSNVTKLEERRSHFPAGWENTEFSKLSDHNELYLRCIRLYIDDRVLKLDTIAEMIGVPDRRFVSSYINRAKKMITNQRKTHPI